MTAADAGALEHRLGTLLGLDAPVLCRTGHDGLLCALLALEVEPGDEIVLPVSICQSMVNAVLVAGALPMLADCRRDLSLCPADLARRLSPASRLIVAHHPHGAACELDDIRDLARAAGIPLLEDCAQAAGAWRAGAPLGQLGDLVLHSFADDKPLSAGVGGLIWARDPALAARLREAARVGSPGHPDDRALGIDAMPRPAELARLSDAIDRFAGDLEARIAKAEAMIAAIGPWGRAIGGVLAGRRPPAHVFHRVVIALDRCATRHALARVIDDYRRATPEPLHPIVQDAVPTPPYRAPHLLARYQRRGRAALCDPDGAEFPGWRAIECCYLFLRTSARFTRPDLMRAVAALEVAAQPAS
ncbi:MAG TPA: DegT/DnrJ/EryC1/StrS family aminotransferase [Kofleriaceae bacterium]|nr:DegT/DnrJ/EryC1/StrS family aminotransferase [Kofleriaceae bacterium]